MIRCRVRKIFARLLLLGALVLSVFLGLGILTTPHAAAAIRQLEEAPGQMVYQSRKTIKDQHRNNWQAIAFKRIRPNGKTSVELRLVAFPGVVEIDRTKPLLLTNSLGKTLTAADVSSNIFTDSTVPEPNIGQYDIQPLLPQLQAEIPLKLTLPTLHGDAINLSVSPSFVQDWQTLLSSRE
jgi:Protein of unknown function (DUF3122)